MPFIERKKCWKNDCNIFLLAISVILHTVYEKNGLVSDLSVLLNDIRDNIEHISMINFLS